MGVVEKEKQAIKYAKELMDLYRYGTPLTYGDDENETVKILLSVIERLEKERDGIYEDYQDLGKEKLKLEEELDRVKTKCTDKEWQHCKAEKMRL